MKWGLGVVLGLFVACSKDASPVTPALDASPQPVIDARNACPEGMECGWCSVLIQAGCGSNEKCTWALSTDPTASGPGLGSITCEPDGSVAIGGACTIVPAAQGGFDNCVGGSVCTGGTCKQICDNNGGAPACGANQACITIDGLFANEGATTTPAGVCEPSCDPLDDNDFDGAGSLHTKTGVACGTDPLEACVGRPTYGAVIPFHCEHTDGQLANGGVAPGPMPASNPCLPGYELAFGTLSDGAMAVTCFAMCRPGDAYLGNPNAQAPNGLSPHGCNNTDALGVFGTIPNGSADSNGAHCEYSWVFEQDSQGQVHHSPTSDTLGYCVDHTQYKYDTNNDGVADTVIPPCAALPLTSTTGLTAVDVGCVRTSLAGPSVAARRPYIEGLPELVRR